MMNVNVFLASSITEYKNERNELGAFIGKLNNKYHDMDIFIDYTVCEWVSDAVAKGRKQDEYNNEIRNSNLVYYLIGREVGKYTLEEFEVAFESYRKNRTPIIHVFFESGKQCSESVTGFRNRLNALGVQHYEFQTLDFVKHQLLNDIADITNTVGTLKLEGKRVIRL